MQAMSQTWHHAVVPAEHYIDIQPSLHTVQSSVQAFGGKVTYYAEAM